VGEGDFRDQNAGPEVEGRPVLEDPAEEQMATLPGILISKIPLAHLLLALAGAAALALRGPERRGLASAALLLIAAMAGAHLLVLAGARGTYGGVRHALPLTLALGVLAGAAAHLVLRRWPRGGGFVSALLLLLTAAQTAGETRLWEFHNALAGGTAGAAELFNNEGVHLGQRLPEVERFWRQELGAPPGPLYALLPIIEEEAVSLGLPLARRVRSIEDDNVGGRYSGLFLAPSGWSRRPWADDLAPLERVARLGNVELLAGDVESPELRASGLIQAVGEYLNANPNPDWATLALRMEELVEVRPGSATGWILLGNCRVALRDRDAALRAFRRASETVPPGDPGAGALRRHVEILEAASSLGTVPFFPLLSAE
ncbi:MAG: hypothetical protein AAF725_24340, partial [Acidobacteriota bacterium]